MLYIFQYGMPAKGLSLQKYISWKIIPSKNTCS